MLQVDYGAYTANSEQVHVVMKKFATVVERYSMDEYFIELTIVKDASRKEIEGYAIQLQETIFEVTGLVGSIGVARSKTYSKLSSSLNKPKGVTLILSDEDEKAFIHPLPISEAWGVDRRREEHILADLLRGGHN